MDKNTDKEKDELFETQPQIIENSDDNVIDGHHYGGVK